MRRRQYFWRVKLGPRVPLARLRYGRGRLDDAVSKYKSLVPEGKAGDFYRDRALYGLARIHLRKGEKAKAAEALKEALTKVPNTALKEEIQARIAQIEDK